MLAGFRSRWMIPRSWAASSAAAISVHDPQRLVNWHRALPKRLRQRRTFDEFHDEVVGANVMDGADVGMIQRRDGAGLTLEPFAEGLG